MFREMFKTKAGKEQIVEELKALFWTHFSDKNKLLNSFAVDELAEDEINYLNKVIGELKTFEK